MSRGLPVIATTLPGFNELIDRDFLFNSDDNDKLIKIFLKLANSPMIYNEQSNRNSEFVKVFYMKNSII